MALQAKVVLYYGKIGRQERGKEKSLALMINIRVTLLRDRFRNLCNIIYCVLSELLHRNTDLKFLKKPPV